MSGLEWFRDGTRIDWPRVVLVALIAAVLGAVLVAAATSAASFGPYNPSWDGTSELRQQVESEPGVESELVRDTARYEASDPNGTVAFVIAPEERYTGEDAARLRRFVANGGTLVVFENFGATGNGLLAAVGAEARADGVVLRDEQEYYRGPTMPVATGVEDHALTEGVDRLTLNYASAIEPGEATVLVRTSSTAYRDADGDGQLSGDEAPDDYPVATVENVSDGRVIAVGDPSIAVNAMLEEPDNAAFLRRTYADADRVLIDLSHGDSLPPLASATLALRQLPLLQALVGALGIAAIGIGSRRPVRPALASARAAIARRFGRDSRGDAVEPAAIELDDDRRAAALRERYPDWDEERIRRVIAALNRDEPKPGDDE